MAITPGHNLTKYIGVPYEKQNCLDIVKAFYKNELDIELSNYYEGDRPSRTEIETLIVSNKGCLRPVELSKAEVGDLIIVNLYGMSCHIAIYIGNNRLLHSIRKVGSCIEPVAKYKKMIEGCYRHQERLA